jgi:Ca2+-binding EF-hand superfamily protein
VSNIILVQLEEEEPSDFIRYVKFEPYMLQIMMKKEYEPAAPEQLHQAFRVLDPKLEGRIGLDVIRELMLHKGIGFRDPQEIDPFISYAADKDEKYIEYEDYIAKKMDEQESHL